MTTQQPLKIERIICGDNLKVLRTIPDESIDLIYIDPPFFTQKNYEVIWNDGEELRQFGDRWITEKSNGTGRASKDINVYLEWMQPRVKELYRVLKTTGSFYLHCDSHADAYLRVMCDSIFPTDACPIIWQRSKGHSLARGLDIITDTILFYTKSNDFFYQQQYDKDIDLEKRFPHIEKETGRRYNHFTLEKSSNIKVGDKTRVIQGKTVKTNLGWVWTQETFDERLKENPHLIYWTANGKPRYKIYADEYKGKKIANLWTDIPMISSGSKERLGYPTQKPEALLDRIIKASSKEGDVVLDAFAGCGTALAVARHLNRQYIGIDVSPTACRLVAKRLNKPISSIEGLPAKPEEIAQMNAFEFQNWVNRELGAKSSPTMSADKGIDGWLENVPIQVKQNQAGRPELDKFVSSILRVKKNKGIFVALAFPSTFKSEIARLKAEQKTDILPITISDIVDKKAMRKIKQAKMAPKGSIIYHRNNRNNNNDNNIE